MNSKQQKIQIESTIKHSNIVEDKKFHLERLSSIMKGVIEKEEIELMWKLIKKYPEQLESYNVAYA